jgi:hypothetical protein
MTTRKRIVGYKVDVATSIGDSGYSRIYHHTVISSIIKVIAGSHSGPNPNRVVNMKIKPYTINIDRRE